MLLAIEHCHSKCIAHRDLKPENFVMETPAKTAPIQLIDFECSKVVTNSQHYSDIG